MNKSQRYPRFAFTLLEMLSAIAIVGALSVMALAGFQSVQKRALRMQCASNLRQIGLAIHQYVGEHDNYLPGPAWVSIPYDVSYYTSMNGYDQIGASLAPYLFDKPVKLNNTPTRCNTLMSPMYRLKRLAPGETAPTYHYIRTTDSKYPFGNQSGTTISSPQKMVSLPELYKKNLSDIWAIRLNDNTLQNGRNYLFFDGHVGWFPTGSEPSQ